MTIPCRAMAALFFNALCGACALAQLQPSIAGYRLGTLRSSLPKDFPCRQVGVPGQREGATESCDANDTLKLGFQRDTLAVLYMTLMKKDDGPASALARWNGRWRTWSAKRLGRPDSVRTEEPLSESAQILKAYWNRQGTPWKAQLYVRNTSFRGGANLTWAYLILKCRSVDRGNLPTCR